MGHLALDMSKWGGDLTAQEAADMWVLGVRTLIFATGPGGYSSAVVSQIDDAVKVGFVIEVYYFVEWGNNPAVWIDSGATALGNLKQHVKRVWIDVEDVNNTPPSTLAAREAYVRQAVERAQLVYGVPVGIYTGGWFWKDPIRGMANSPAFSSYSLWNSYYDNDSDIDGLPYGGWTAADVAIEQYTGTVIVAGQSVDTNWAYKPMTNAIEVPPDNMNNFEELNQAVMQRFDIIQVASGDYLKMVEAWNALKSLGLLS